MEIRKTAIKVSQGEYTYYLTTLPSKDLFQISFISRKQENKEQGFQRLLNKSRAKLITKYYENGGIIPTPIITSLQCEYDNNLYFDNNKNEIVLKNMNENALMVLDGQHRLYGLSELEESVDVPVVIFTGLTLRDEARLFIDINTNQKGVPSALLLDIKNIAETADDIEIRQRKLFDYLNIEGPLAGNLYGSESRRGGISRTAFNEATRTVFVNSLLANEPDTTIQKVVLNYLDAFSKLLLETNNPNASILRTNVFKSILGIFDDVINKVLSIENNLKIDSIYNIIEPIGGIDFSQHSGTNRQAQASLEKEMRLFLHKKTIVELNSGDFF